MTRPAVSVALIAICGGAAFGQAPAAAPTFEVASIRIGAPFSMALLRAGGIGMKIEGDRVVIRSWTLADLIGAAYSVRTDQITGPDWIGQRRFDVQGKMPDGSKPSQVPDMLQGLLAERFKMIATQDQKIMQVYTLTAAKGQPKIRESTPGDSTPSGCVLTSGGHHDCHRMTMADLANMLTQLNRMYLSMPPGAMDWGINLPAVDETGLTGVYDFNMDFGPGSEDGGGPVGDAIDRMGLRLESQKRPYPHITVEHLEKMPTAN